MLIHWTGGRDSELRVKKRRIGDNGLGTFMEALNIIRKMTGRFSDIQIDHRVIVATQIVRCAPWEIVPEALDAEAVRAAVNAVKRGRGLPRDPVESDSLSLEFGSAD